MHAKPILRLSKGPSRHNTVGAALAPPDNASRLSFDLQCGVILPMTVDLPEHCHPEPEAKDLSGNPK